MDEKVIEKVKVKVMSSMLHRNVLGALGMLLPVISIIGGLFVRNKPPCRLSLSGTSSRFDGY